MINSCYLVGSIQKKVWAEPGNIREWYRRQIGRRLCEGRTRAVFSFEDAKERLRVYLGKWAKTKKGLRVFYDKALKNRVVDAWDDLPEGVEIFTEEILTGTRAGRRGNIEIPGVGDAQKSIWANTAVQVRVDQLTYSSSRTLLPKAAEVEFNGAIGRVSVLELLYALEPEGFEEIASFRSLERIPYFRSIRGKFVGYYLSKTARSASEIIRPSFTPLPGLNVEGVLEKVRREKFPHLPKRGLSVYPTKNIAREWATRLGIRGIYVVSVEGTVSKQEGSALVDVEKAVSTGWFARAEQAAGDYWSINFTKYAEVLVDGRVTVMGRLT